ncbi:MAG: sigma-70 family RNA polymerase sigma factor [Isosphaeraceae bacterium]
MMRKTGGTSLRLLGGLFDLGAASNASDGQLLEHFATGPAATAEAAFAALLERHGPMVLGVCRTILRDEHSAMDAFQATFLVLIRKGRSLWVRESLGPWLHRVAGRAAGRVKKDSARQRRLALHVAERTPEQTATAVSPSHRDELALVLHEELDRLPDRFRMTILLCDLEGRTCEETARLLACPVGTVASRLARGRQRLRVRLARRGLAPEGSALAAAFSRETAGATLPAALRESTIRIALSYAATRTTLGASSSSIVSLATTVSWSLFMNQVRSLAILLVCAGCIAPVSITAFRALASSTAPSQSPTQADRPAEKPKQGETAKTAVATAPKPDRRKKVVLFDQKEAFKDSLMGTVGNMRPLLNDDERGSRFQTRFAELYKDGSVKVYNPDAKDPIAPPMRHKGPIREVGFIEQSRLMITTSDDSVKIWDALSGALRKELDGEVMRPLVFTSVSTCAEPGPEPLRFVTIDVAGRAITTWDASTLEKVGTFRPEGTTPLLGAGLTRDGKLLATIAADRSVTVWFAGSHKPLATLYGLSPVAASCFADEVTGLKKPVLRLRDDFWKDLAPLVPAKEL